MKKVSVIIPVYNEAASISVTIYELKQCFESQEKYDLEVIAVNDGSTDESASVLKIDFPEMMIVDNIINMGYGYSLKRGIEKATSETIVIIDADGSYPVHQLIQMIDRFEQGLDLVVGSREKTFIEDSFFKSLFRWCLKFLVEFTAGVKIPDVNSGMRIFRKSTIISYFPYLSNKFSFTTSMTLHYALDAKKMEFIPNGYRKRIGQSKVKIIKDSFRTLQFIVEIIAVKNPLKLHLMAMIPTVILLVVFSVYGVLFKVLYPALILSCVLLIQGSICVSGLFNARK